MADPVLYVLNRFGRLSETFILTEIAALEARGERVLVDALKPPEDGPRHCEAADLKAQVRYLPPKPSWRDRPIAQAHVRWVLRNPVRWGVVAWSARRNGTWRQFLQAGLVAQRVRAEHARHIHAHFASRSAEVARDAAALAGVPYSVTAHAYDIYRHDNAPLLAARTEGASAVITVSQHNVDHLRSVLPVAARVRLVPNGMPLPHDAHGPSASILLLCVSRLVAKKGVDVLLQALAQLPADVSLEIIGAGPLDVELQALAADLGLGARVRFLGSQDSAGVNAAYRRAFAVVLAPRVAPNGDRDGLPTVFLEALARGLPVISTDVVGVSELVKHERTGLLVPPEDPAAFAQAVRRLQADPDGARRMGRDGRRWVEEHYDPARSAGLLSALMSTHGT